MAWASHFNNRSSLMNLPLAIWGPLHYPQPVIWIGCLVCFILIVVKMFQNGAGTMGIVTLVASLCCGLGTIIALVVGWMNADRWGIRNLMIVYTVFIVSALIFGAIAPTPEVAEYRHRIGQ
jgi:hypothetical protein